MNKDNLIFNTVIIGLFKFNKNYKILTSLNQTSDPAIYKFTITKLGTTEKMSWNLSNQSAEKEVENIKGWIKSNCELKKGQCGCELYVMLRNGCKCGAIKPYEFKIAA